MQKGLYSTDPTLQMEVNEKLSKGETTESLVTSPDMAIQVLQCHYNYYSQLKIPKQYMYMITFTKRDDCQYSEEDIEQIIEKQAKRTALQIVEFSYVKEYTKKGIAHWHCYVKSKVSLAKDRFKYYSDKIGYVDISKSKSQNSQNIIDYMEKEKDAKIVKVV